MSSEVILMQVSEILREVFDRPDLVVSAQTTAKDVDDWDSLTNINVILSMERAFSVHFGGAEVARLANVGELVELIRQKTSS